MEWDYARAKQRESRRQGATATHRNLRSLASIDALVTYVQRIEGWTISLGGLESEVLFEEKRINLATNSSAAAILATLMHECGHMLLYQQDPDMFSDGWPYTDGPKHKQNVSHVTATLEEECAAWMKGEELAKQLGIWYDPKTLKRVKSRALMSYIEWGFGLIRQ